MKKKQKIKQSDLQGFKYFKKLSQMLERLQDVGCQRDRAGNRILHMDQYMTPLLLCMFSPISKSLRSMQQASELKKVQKKLRVPRSSLLNNQIATINLIYLTFSNIFCSVFRATEKNVFLTRHPGR